MKCFLCKKRMAVPGLSIRTRNQPSDDVDEFGYARFCPNCTTRLYDAIDGCPKGRAFVLADGEVPS